MIWYPYIFRYAFNSIIEENVIVFGQLLCQKICRSPYDAKFAHGVKIIQPTPPPQHKATTYIPFFITMSNEDLTQETEETLNEKSGISFQTIDNSENVPTMT